ncbi:hypothetical protein ACSMXM_04990 [Pacificimonas sp. ICDLI1SI03]
MPKDDLVRLADVLRQEESTLTERAAIAKENGYAFGDFLMPNGVIDLRARWIGPNSLAEASYHRFAWNNRLLPFCPVSAEKLVDKCSYCEHQLRWRHCLGLDTCERCGEVVTRSPAPSLDERDMDGYRTMARLMSFRADDRQAALEEKAPRLAIYDGGTVAFVSLSLVKLLTDGSERNRHVRSILAMETRDRAALVAKAGDLLAEWPESLHKLLENAVGETEGDHRSFLSLWKTLKRMANPNLSGSVAMSDILINALPDLRGNLWKGLGGNRRTYQVQEAVRVLGIHHQQFTQLVDDEAVSFTELPSRMRRNLKLGADEIDTLGNEIESSVTIRSVALRIGIPVYGVEQVAAENLIEHLSSKGMRSIYELPRVCFRSVDSFLAKIEANAAPGPVPLEAKPMHHCASLFGGELKPWAAMMRALLDGSINFWKNVGPFRSSGVFVIPSEIALLRGQRFNYSKYDFPFAQEMAQLDSGEVLNVSSALFLRAGLADLLGCRPYRQGLYADVDDVRKLAAKIVSPMELAMHWDVSIRKVKFDPRLTGVPRSTFGWDRRMLVASGLLTKFS